MLMSRRSPTRLNLFSLQLLLSSVQVTVSTAITILAEGLEAIFTRAVQLCGEDRLLKQY